MLQRSAEFASGILRTCVIHCSTSCARHNAKQLRCWQLHIANMCRSLKLYLYIRIHVLINPFVHVFYLSIYLFTYYIYLILYLNLYVQVYMFLNQTCSRAGKPQGPWPSQTRAAPTTPPTTPRQLQRRRGGLSQPPSRRLWWFQPPAILSGSNPWKMTHENLWFILW